MSSMFFVFFNDTATTEIYTLSLHDALPISIALTREGARVSICARSPEALERRSRRSEEHTSELQSLRHIVCRLLLEKKRNSPRTYSGCSKWRRSTSRA